MEQSSSIITMEYETGRPRVPEKPGLHVEAKPLPKQRLVIESVSCLAYMNPWISGTAHTSSQSREVYAEGFEVQVHPHLYKELKTSLSYLRPHIQQ